MKISKEKISYMTFKEIFDEIFILVSILIILLIAYSLATHNVKI